MSTSTKTELLRMRSLSSICQQPNNIYPYTLVVYKFDPQPVSDPLDNLRLGLDRSIHSDSLDDK